MDIRPDPSTEPQQPSTPITPAPDNPTARIDTSKIYPAATATPQVNPPTVNQAFAGELNRMRSKAAAQPISIRLRSLLILSICGLGITGYYLFVAISVLTKIHTILPANLSATAARTIGFSVALDLLQIAVYIYLLLSKDKHGVLLVLRVILVLEVIGLLGLFFGGAVRQGVELVISAILLLFTYYTYSRVKTLEYL